MIIYPKEEAGAGEVAEMGKISRIRNKAKRAAKHRIYLDSLKKPVWEKSFLLISVVWEDIREVLAQLWKEDGDMHIWLTTSLLRRLTSSESYGYSEILL